jgi:hypothetical protein
MVQSSDMKDDNDNDRHGNRSSDKKIQEDDTTRNNDTRFWLVQIYVAKIVTYFKSVFIFITEKYKTTLFLEIQSKSSKALSRLHPGSRLSIIPSVVLVDL